MAMSSEWKERNRPIRLERHYQFDNYEELRDFLERAADLSESEGYYPDMGLVVTMLMSQSMQKRAKPHWMTIAINLHINLMNCLAKTQTEENTPCPLLLL